MPDRRHPGEDEELLRAALPDVEPLGKSAPERIRRRQSTGRRAPEPAPPPLPAGSFRVEWQGERVSGWWGELPPAALAARTPIAAAATLDLHGLDREAARERLGRFLAESHRARRRAVRVITGRGRGRAAGGVLQREVPGWLAAPPLAAWILAFASAPAAEGGAGALRILLRS